MLVVTLTLLLVAQVSSYPAQDAEDTGMVGSSVHETKIEPPQDLQAAGDHSGKGGKGYHHSHKHKGGNGYKHFDSFHKKDGDSYGYEKHSKFGKGDQGEGRDNGAYHESSSYSSGDGGSSGSHQKPKFTAYHFESKSGTPRDYSNYDPETYVGDYTQLAPRSLKPGAAQRLHPDVEISGPLQGEPYQSLYDVTEDSAGKKKVMKKRQNRNKDPQTAGTEEDAEYDYYGGEEGGGEEGDGGSYEAEYEGGGGGGGDYEGEGSSEGDYYY